MNAAPPGEPAEVVVGRRFNGPPASANGGYLAGLLAQHADATSGGAVVVTLRLPPPLEVPLRVVPAADAPAGVRLLHGEALVAEAGPAVLGDPVTEPVDFAAAGAASGRYAGFAHSPFPGCFTCGPAREPGDGLRLFAGPLDGRDGVTAGPWVPDASLAGPDGTVRPEIAWAALDCPGAWTLDLTGRPVVLGRMAARIDRLPRVGDRYTVTGRRLRLDGRKAFTATGLYDADGELLARAEQVWISIDPATVAPNP
jgi:hypothetical protein